MWPPAPFDLVVRPAAGIGIHLLKSKLPEGNSGFSNDTFGLGLINFCWSVAILSSVIETANRRKRKKLRERSELLQLCSFCLKLS
jgi:hypothetical protein